MSFPVREEYNLSRAGFWGPVTSTLDWCEANYLFSHYIAEYANTLSNVVTIGFGLYGMWFATALRLPTRYIVQFMMIGIIGAGSFWFHCSLLYSAQLSDELPMILSVSCSIFILFDTPSKVDDLKTFDIGGNARSRAVLLATFLFDIAFTYSYWIYRNPVYHQFVFASMMLMTVARASFLTRYSEASKRLSPSARGTISRLYRTGALMFILAFLIWNLDNIYCDSLSGLKITLGWPAAFLLEGHAWWHCLTAVGGYYMVNGTAYLTLSIKDGPKKYQIRYVHAIPRIVRTVDNKS